MTVRGRFALYAPADSGVGGGFDDVARRQYQEQRRQQQEIERAVARTAEAFIDRMTELGLTTAELTRRSGVSEPVIRDLRNGVLKDYHDKSLSSLSRHVGWHYRALADMLAGREPEAPEAPDDSGPVRIVEQTRAELEAALEAMIERAEGSAELAREALRRLRET